MRPWMRFTLKQFVLLAGKAARAFAKIVKSTPQRVDLLLAVRFQSLPQKWVASELGVTPPVVSRMVDALEKLGLVKRVIPLADKRIRLVCLTVKGQAVLYRLHDNYFDYEEDGHHTMQSTFEENFVHEWEPFLKEAGVATELLSLCDQRPLLEYMQPAVWRTTYYGDPKWDNPLTPFRHPWGGVRQLT